MAQFTFSGPSAVMIYSLGSLIHEISGPVLGALAQTANWVAPIVEPPIGSLIQAFNHGFITEGAMTDGMQLQGANYDGVNQTQADQRRWLGVVNAAKPILTVQEAARAYNSGLIPGGWYNWYVRHNGYKDEYYRDIFRFMEQPIDLSTVMKLDRLGVIPQGQREFWYGQSGYDSTNDYGRRILLAQEPHVWLPAECVALNNRGLLSDDDVTKNLTADKYLTPQQRKKATSLHFPVPSWRDFIGLNMMGLNGLTALDWAPWLQEYPDSLRDAAQYDGKAVRLGDVTDAVGGLGQRTLAELQWAMHWSTINVSLAANIRDRVRQDNLAQWQQLFPTITPFSDDNVRFWAKAAGIHPAIREQVVAATYTPISQRQILWAGEYLEWNNEQLYGAVRGDGYAPHDAHAIAEALSLRILALRLPFTELLWKHQRGQVAANYVEMFQDGIVTREIATAGLKDLGMPESRIPRTLDDAMRAKQGSDQIKQQRKIEALADRTQLQEVDAVLARFKARDINRALATRSLETLGLRPEQITSVLNAAMHQERARRATARHEQTERIRLNARQQHIKAVSDSYGAGLLIRTVAQSLLQGAGLDAQTAIALLDAQEARVNLAEAKRAVASVRTQLLSGAVSLAEAATLLARSGMSPEAAARRITFWTLQMHTKHRVAAAAEVLRWVKKGLMTRQVASLRLANLGYSGADAQLALAEAAQGLASLQAHATDAVVKRRATAVAQLTKLQKSHDSQVKTLQAYVRRIIPRATLGKWYKIGKVGKEYAINILIAQGEPKDIAELYIEEWDNEASRPSSGQVSQAATGPTVPGTTTNGTKPS